MAALNPLTSLLSQGASDVIRGHQLRYQYSDTATGQDNALLRGQPDRSLVNRHERYEVLAFINAYCKSRHLTTLNQALDVEDRLHRAPSNIRSRERLAEWLDNPLLAAMYPTMYTANILTGGK